MTFAQFPVLCPWPLLLLLFQMVHFKKNHSAFIAATGGLASYHFTITAGNLPSSLTTNSFTAQISGIPMQRGSFSFEVRVSDYDEAMTSQWFNLVISHHCINDFVLSGVLTVPQYKVHKWLCNTQP